MNHLNSAIDVIYQRLENELVQYADSADKISTFTNILDEVGINMAAVLDVRTTNTYADYMGKLDNVWSSLMIDCGMDLQVRMESEAPGSYGELRDIIVVAARRVANSMLVPDNWEVEPGIEEEAIDDATILRVIVGYAVPLLAGRISELIEGIRKRAEQAARSEQAKE